MTAGQVGPAAKSIDFAMKSIDLTTKSACLAAKPIDFATKSACLAAKPIDLATGPACFAAKSVSFAAEPADPAAEYTGRAACPPARACRRPCNHPPGRVPRGVRRAGGEPVFLEVPTMGQFPKNEAQVVILAQAIASGLTPGDPEPHPHFPDPPVTPAQLTALLTEYTNAKNATVAAKAAAEQATTDKNAKLAELVAGMKTTLRYAENTVNYDDDKLKEIGWAGRKSASPLQPPGQPRTLQANRQGEGWVTLEWKAPVDGGKPAAYRIVRRERPAGPWMDVAAAMICESTLSDQPRGKEFEYRVIAANRAGESEPSNTVLVVL
jgi:hypothetical protein